MTRLTDKPPRSSPPRTPGPSGTPGPYGLRPRQPADPTLQQRAWAALMLACVSLIGMMLVGNARRGVYVVGVALVIAAGALWLALTAMSRARRAGSGRPRGGMLAAILGGLSLAFSVIVLINFALFWPQLTQLSNCMNGANTISAQQACQQQYNNSVNGEIGLFGG